MRKRITKKNDEAINMLLKLVCEYKRYQYYKQPNKELLAKQQQSGENIEIIKYREWFLKEYRKDPDEKMWERETVLEYALYYQVWSMRKNQNSWATKQIYREEALKFSKYAAHQYNVQDYRNIKNKHIQSYVKSLIEQGLKPITMQKKLYAIYYYYKILGGSNKLMSIKEVLEDV